MSYMTYIDIFDKLSIDDYYKTDSHWKQENITDVAEFISECMGADAKQITLKKKISWSFLKGEQDTRGGVEMNADT